MGYRSRNRLKIHGPHEQAYMWVTLVVALTLYICLCLCRKATKEPRPTAPPRTQNVPLNNLSQAAPYPRGSRVITVPTVRPMQVLPNVPYAVVNEFTNPPASAPPLPAPATFPTHIWPLRATNEATAVPETPPPSYEQAAIISNSRTHTPIPERNQQTK